MHEMHAKRRRERVRALLIGRRWSLLHGRQAFRLASPLTVCKGIPMAISITKNIGMLLLAIWLILSGVIPLLSLSFAGLGTIMAILAIVAGVFILLGR